MESNEGGLCRGCAGTGGGEEWETSSEASRDTSESGIFDPDTASGPTAAGTDGDGGSADGQDSSAESQTNSTPTDTGTGSHIIDPAWNDGVDTAALEQAATAARTNGDDTENELTDPLDRKIDSWREQLLDLTRRSNLVDFTVTKTKSLPFHRADPLAVGHTLFDREPLYIRRSESEDEGGAPADPDSTESNEVASIRPNEATETSLYQITLRQKRFQRERGVDSLFIALGTLRWYEVSQSDTELRSPLFLVQVDLSEEPNRDANRHDYELISEDADLQVNPALRKMLAAERGLELPPDEAFDLDELETAFAYIDELISGFDRWRIAPEVILGIFDFSKFGLYTDLEENREAIKNDPFVQAINGDPSALPTPPNVPSAAELDEAVSPADTYQVLDADSSQQEAIEAAKRGMSFVLQGPPGTGKSQTISNIIAEKMAAGETVLFVSEKQAALNVVKDRLDDAGLGRFCLEAHGKKASKKAILDDLERELQSAPLRPPSDRDDIVNSVKKTRWTLNQYQERLFYQPAGQEITPYEALGIISKRDTYPRIDATIGDPTSFEQSEIDQFVDDLQSLAAYDSELNRNDSHPWRHSTLAGWRVDAAETTRATLSRAIEHLTELRKLIDEVTTTVDRSIQGIDDLRAARELITKLTEFPVENVAEQHFSRSLYAREERLRSLTDLHRKLEAERSELLAHYDASFFSETGTTLHAELSAYGSLRYVSLSYRRLKRQMLAHADEGYAPDIEGLREDARTLMRIQTLESDLDQYTDFIDQLGHLYDETETDWEQLFEFREWVADIAANELIDTDTARAISTDPAALEDVRDLETHLETALAEWDEIRAALGNLLDLDAIRVDGNRVAQANLSALTKWFQHRLDTVDQLQGWIQYKESRDPLLASPIGDFIEAYLEAGHPAADLVDTFNRNFYTEWLNAVYADTALDSFSATEYNDLLETFRELDKQQQEHAKAEIQHRVTNRRPQMELEHASSSEQVILRREVQKSRKHMPLRQLFEQTSGLITDLKPCFMMSPLSVAQYLKLETITFDTVIFDEASQIMPQDAVSSLIRGDQVIIAGDSKQLPPTSFFDADIETAEDVREDLESILDEAATVLPEKRLLWHYRSNTNELIEFSNTKCYNGALRTFPDNNPDEQMGVDFVYVEDGLYDRGGSSTNEPEAQRILKLINEHIETRPSKSLGVVAFSSAQAQAIRDTIEEARETDPDLDAFASEDDALEGFFVKSLENVQGDERDALLFSVGYGPDASGKITMNFGPLNHTGGERRLNVAVTRAKDHIQIVSSMQPSEIDLGRTGARGVEDFKHYLEYAKHGERALARQDSEPETLEFDSEFEEAVYTALEDRGFDVVTQVQSSGYSIDLAIKHPETPGKYVLGIECDGAAYHSSKTARDRDRTRQMVLEDLGWTIHRIWSPDWASNKEREIEAIESKVSAEINGTAAPDGGTAMVEVEEVDVDAIPEGERGGINEYLTEWEEPALKLKKNRTFDDVSDGVVGGVLIAVADEFGPGPREQLFRTTISRWDITRLGKNIRQSMDQIVRDLSQRGDIVTDSGFIWPGDRPDRIEVRTNSGDENRPIDEIPVEELARAGHLILEAGTQMTQEDLVLEIARLYGYSRLGSRIEDRLDEAVEILLIEGCATETAADGYIEYVAADVDRILLDRVYGKGHLL
jgi:very-short-patch-repair endonuclease